MTNSTSRIAAFAATWALPAAYERTHDQQPACSSAPAMPRTVDRTELLRSVSVFGRLTEEQLALLAASLGTQSFKRGQTIFQQGDGGDTLHLIAQGQVRIYHPSMAGRELSVAIFREGDFFGELALLDEGPRSASAEAMVPTVTLTLERGAFQQTIHNHPAIAEAMLAEIASRLRASTNYAEHLANPSAQHRVGWLLLDLARRYGVPGGDGTRIDLCLTQDDLASMFGVARETINRVLMRLRDQSLIAIVGGQIFVRDCTRLERALDAV
jgi:CRP/FNR family transcriptional regulator, cyclic AMP receptor protein